MKSSSKVVSIVLAAVFAFTTAVCFGQNSGGGQYDPESDFESEPDPDRDRNGVLMISKYLGNKKAVKIPPNIKNLAVTGIAGSAFKEKQLSSVIIPDSVIWIGWYAFDNNQLTSITIPDSVKLVGGFSNNRLTSITIPNSVTEIGWYAFSNNRLTSVTIPNSVTWIGAGAFSGNQLTSITIPNSVKDIWYEAFISNPLSSVTIPGNLELGKNAFPEEFIRVYWQNNRTGGTYRKDANNNWKKE